MRANLQNDVHPSLPNRVPHVMQAQGADGYVLDIRSNGGGLFPAGVEVARMWINRGELVLIADR